MIWKPKIYGIGYYFFDGKLIYFLRRAWEDLERKTLSVEIDTTLMIPRRETSLFVQPNRMTDKYKKCCTGNIICSRLVLPGVCSDTFSPGLLQKRLTRRGEKFPA